jgi:Alpha-galactosidases/6-phospho-beta-glucosidases, family 4 of glycosyl hydrolases
MKLAVIGGGGVRSVFLAKSLSQNARAYDIDTLAFQDIDEKKLSVYGTLAKEAAYRIDPKVKFSLTLKAEEALEGADYVITTIRAGGDLMRARDERAALDKGLLGQETTGAAGYSFAMRSIPALLKYMELAKKVASPSVKVFNFTNPAGIVSEALRAAGYDFTYGICDAPSGFLREAAKVYNAESSEISGECFGLNHLSFFNSIKIRGREVIGEIIENPGRIGELRYFPPELIKKLGLVPNEYLYYFYFREDAVRNILKAGRTRGEVIADINERMTAALSKIDIARDFGGALSAFEEYYGMRENSYMANESGVRRENAFKFDLFSKDEGGYAGVALGFIKIISSGRAGDIILSVPNCGAVEGLEKEDVAEVTCTVDKDNCAPHEFKNIPAPVLELIRRVKFYEREGARAILTGDRALAKEALSAHPLVNSYKLGGELIDEYAEINKKFIALR